MLPIYLQRRDGKFYPTHWMEEGLMKSHRKYTSLKKRISHI